MSGDASAHDASRLPVEARTPTVTRIKVRNKPGMQWALTGEPGWGDSVVCRVVCGCLPSTSPGPHARRDETRQFRAVPDHGKTPLAPDPLICCSGSGYLFLVSGIPGNHRFFVAALGSPISMEVFAALPSCCPFGPRHGQNSVECITGILDMIDRPHDAPSLSVGDPWLTAHLTASCLDVHYFNRAEHKSPDRDGAGRVDGGLRIPIL